MNTDQDRQDNRKYRCIGTEAGSLHREENEMEKEQKLMWEMTEYYSGDPARIQHFMKVYIFARMIGEKEQLDEESLEILGAAALVHDIGIRVAEEKYGSCAGHWQELEGPPVAQEMLERIGYSKAVTARVSYLVGHHHTYTKIDGADYQILVEADFLVNLFEGMSNRKAVWNAYNKIFRTEAGKDICRTMFRLEDGFSADEMQSASEQESGIGEEAK